MKPGELVRLKDNEANRPIAEEHSYLWVWLSRDRRHAPTIGRYRSLATGKTLMYFDDRFETVPDAEQLSCPNPD